MLIETNCPHCSKGYRLRDEFVGKRVVCKNPECAKPFTVADKLGGGINGVHNPPLPPVARPIPPIASAPPKPAPPVSPTKKTPSPAAPLPPLAKPAPEAKKAPPKKPPAPEAEPIDAEAMAAALFGEPEKPADAAEDARVVDMTCAMCDHKWTEPFAKQGKFTVCPDCRHRQKVPDQKKKKAIDWRDPNADRPTLAKGEELPEDLKEQQTRSVGIDALEKAGAIDGPDIEPRPFRQKLTIGLALVGTLLAIAFLGIYWFRSRSDSRDQQYMPDALKDLASLKDDMPGGQGPLLRALLHNSAGEFAARGNSKAKRDEALRHFLTARGELESKDSPKGKDPSELDLASKSLERDLLLGELAVSLLSLGGKEDQVLAETRIRWQHQITQGNKPRIGGDTTTIQAELRRTLTAIRREGPTANFEVREAVVRRLALELNRRDQLDLLEEILGQFFNEVELPEAIAEVALELYRAGNTGDRVRSMAEQVKATAPISAYALMQLVDPATKLPPVIGPPSGSDSSLASRSAYLLLAVCKDDTAEVTRIANLPGQTADRLKALAFAASFSKDPGLLLQTAVEVLENDKRPEPRVAARFALLQLCQAAARAKDVEKSKAFAAAIPDPGLRAWALGESLRLRLAATPDQKSTTAPDLPEDANSLRVGHAWGCLAFARHNAAARGDSSAIKQYGEWMTGLSTFGKAGLALGLQDRNQK